MTAFLRGAARAATSHLQDHSMLAHDSNAIPGFPLRRPRAPSATRHTIFHLVKAHDVHLAAPHLSSIATTDPSTIPTLVHAIRRYLLPSPARRTHNPSHPLTLLHHLVHSVPYFYRYIATPAFFRAFWRLQADRLSTLTVRLLLAAWARDLAPMHAHHDPAAAFWVLTHRRLARHLTFPVPPNRPFVRRVPLSPANRALAAPHRIAQDDIPASLRLVDQLVKASVDTPDPHDLRRQSASLHPRVCRVETSPTPSSPLTDPAERPAECEKQCPVQCSADCPQVCTPKEKPVDTPPRLAKPCCGRKYELNEKLVAVIRRHDALCGHSDPYYIAPPTRMFDSDSGTLPYSRFSRSSGSTSQSVAAVARENARRRLDETRTLSWSVSYHADRSSTDADGESFMEGLTVEDIEDAAKVAVTPSTFAGLKVEETGEVEQSLVEECERVTPVESVGDTVLLPAGGFQCMPQAAVMYGNPPCNSLGSSQ